MRIQHTASGYSYVKIKDKVISESLAQVQKDLEESWDKLVSKYKTNDYFENNETNEFVFREMFERK
jgi:hypothetical protein